MSKLLTATAFIAGLASAPAVAAETAMLETAFGATIVATHPDGRQAKLWLNRDGTYSAQGRRGGRSGGVWKVVGEKVCLTQHRPVRIPLRQCRTFPNVQVGGSWRDRANGQPVTVTLRAGR